MAASTGRKMSCPVALRRRQDARDQAAAARRTSGCDDRPSAIGHAPVPRPTTTPQSRSSCHGSAFEVAEAEWRSTTRSAITVTRGCRSGPCRAAANGAASPTAQVDRDREESGPRLQPNSSLERHDQDPGVERNPAHHEHEQGDRRHGPAVVHAPRRQDPGGERTAPWWSRRRCYQKRVYTLVSCLSSRPRSSRIRATARMAARSFADARLRPRARAGRDPNEPVLDPRPAPRGGPALGIAPGGPPGHLPQRRSPATCARSSAAASSRSRLGPTGGCGWPSSPVPEPACRNEARPLWKQVQRDVRSQLGTDRVARLDGPAAGGDGPRNLLTAQPVGCRSTEPISQPAPLGLARPRWLGRPRCGAGRGSDRDHVHRGDAGRGTIVFVGPPTPASGLRFGASETTSVATALSAQSEPSRL